MTTALDTAIRKVVANLATKLGTAITVRVITAGTYNTATGGATDTNTDAAVQGFTLTETALDRFGLAKVADLAVLVPASSLTTEPVTTQDRFVVSSVVYTIQKVDKIGIRDLNACYVLHGAGAG